MQDRLDALAPGEQDLVLLPEYATTPGLEDRERLRACAESDGTAFLDAVAAAARRLSCSVAIAAPVRAGAGWFNRTLVFDRRGELALTYDKIGRASCRERV